MQGFTEKSKPPYYMVEVDDISDDDTNESQSIVPSMQKTNTCRDWTVPSRQVTNHNIPRLVNNNRNSLNNSTDILSSIFDGFEKLRKNIENEKSKIEEFHPNLASLKGSLKLVPEETSFQSKEITFENNLNTEIINNQPQAISNYCRAHTLNRRKSTKPVRSAIKHDPNFRGVTVNMKTKVQGDDSKLIMACTVTSRKASRIPHTRNRRCSVGPTESPSSDSEDNSQYLIKQAVYFAEKLPWRYSSLGGKVCASCATRKTPLWRDAEDGTPLCNACGIRYKKYRVRCSRCWHIPKKDGKSYPHCPCCGSLLSISCKRSW